MARPILVTKNTKELVQRAQSNVRNSEFVSVTGLAVPHRKADREDYLETAEHDNRKEIRAHFGIPYPIIDAASLIVDNDGKTLVRVAKVIAEIGDDVHYTSAEANGILAKVERGSLDIEGFLDALKR